MFGNLNYHSNRECKMTFMPFFKSPVVSYSSPISHSCCADVREAPPSSNRAEAGSRQELRFPRARLRPSELGESRKRTGASIFSATEKRSSRGSGAEGNRLKNPHGGLRTFFERQKTMLPKVVLNQILGRFGCQTQIQ
jgi:hypothetical protein